MSNLETISIYAEGTGVHICIPNITIDEVKKMIAGTFISTIAKTSEVSLTEVKSDLITDDELESETSAETKVTEVTERKVTEQIETPADKKEEVKLPFPEVASETPSASFKPTEEPVEEKENLATESEEAISEETTDEVTENSESNTESIVSEDVIETPESNSSEDIILSEDELPWNKVEEQQAEEINNEINPAAVISSAPEIAPEYEEDANETVEETIETPAEPTDEVTDTTEESNVSKEVFKPTKDDTANGMLLLKVKPEKLAKNSIDKILSGFYSVASMRMKFETSIKENNAILVNVSGMSQEDINYVLHIARMTNNFILD